MDYDRDGVDALYALKRAEFNCGVNGFFKGDFILDSTCVYIGVNELLARVCEGDIGECDGGVADGCLDDTGCFALEFRCVINVCVYNVGAACALSVGVKCIAGHFDLDEVGGCVIVGFGDADE